MKKLCAVVLFAFVASLFAAGAALAIVKHEPDLRPVDPRLCGAGVVDGGARLLVVPLQSNDASADLGAVIGELENFNAFLPGTLQLVSHDLHPFRSFDVEVGPVRAGIGTGWPFNLVANGRVVDQAKPALPLGSNWFDYISNDYDFLQLYSQDAGLYYNVPDSVVALLRGGPGRYPKNFAWGDSDYYGYTVGVQQTRNIVNLNGVNPALATSTLDSSVIDVYLHSTDIHAAAFSNAVSVPVALNVTYNVAASWNPARTVYNTYPGGLRFTGVPVAPALPDIVPDAWLNDSTHPNWPIKWRIPRALVRAYPSDETRVPYWNNRFAGMRAGDIRLIKVSVGDAAGEQIEYQRVDRGQDLQQQRFVVTRFNLTTGQDTVLGPNDRIEGSGTVYRIVYRDRDGINGVDFSRPGSDGVIVSSPAIIFAENPIIKQPDVAGNEPVTSHWVMGYKPADHTDVGRDGEFNQVAMPNDGTQIYWENLYPDYTRELFGVEADALWHTAAAIASYGFDLANVIRFPATLANVPVGNTAIVLYTLRPGGGFGGSAGLDMLTAGSHTISDLQVINVTGNADMPRNYTLVTNVGDLRDGTFAVLEQVPGTPWRQRVITDPAHVFQAGKVYFLAVAARDGGDFDVDQGTQGNNVGKNNQCVHFSVFATVGAPAPSIEPTVEPTPEPSEEPTPTPSGSSGGGCSVGFAPAAVLLLAPLFVLLKK